MKVAIRIGRGALRMREGPCAAVGVGVMSAVMREGTFLGGVFGPALGVVVPVVVAVVVVPVRDDTATANVALALMVVVVAVAALGAGGRALLPRSRRRSRTTCGTRARMCRCGSRPGTMSRPRFCCCWRG